MQEIPSSFPGNAMDHTDILVSDDGSEAGTTASDSTIKPPIVTINGVSTSPSTSPDQFEPYFPSQTLSDPDLQTRRGRYETGRRLEILSNTLKDLQAFSRTSSNRITSHFRDTPIYTEPGSPLLGQAYYPFTHTTRPFSASDVVQSPLTVHESSGSRTTDAIEKETTSVSSDTDSEDLDSSKPLPNHPHSPSLSAVQDGTDETDESDETDETDETERRLSALSFQCVGDLFRDEAAWLSSPLNWWNRSESGCLPYILSQNMPLQEKIDLLSNDNDSCIYEEEEVDEEDLLACATALAPAKANVINVNGQLSIEVPPRSSSLGTTAVNPTPDMKAHGSWMTFGDGDDSESESDDDDDSPHSEVESFMKPFWQPSLSQRGMDLAMPSPPQSPTLSLGDDPKNLNFPSGPPHLLSNGSSYPIMASLEDHVNAFPTPMLLADSACTLAIRRFLRFPPNCPPSPANSDEWTSENHSADSKIHQNSTTQWSPPRNEDTRLFPSPDLEPLRNTFPDTSNFMRSALYAHLLSYIFVTSIPIKSIPSQRRQPRHQQNASASSIPSKAASLLGMDEASSLRNAGPHHGETESLKSRLRDNIERIISGIDGSFEVGGSRFGRASSISPAFFRSLIELVRLSEGL